MSPDLTAARRAEHEAVDDAMEDIACLYSDAAHPMVGYSVKKHEIDLAVEAYNAARDAYGAAEYAAGRAAGLREAAQWHRAKADALAKLPQDWTLGERAFEQRNEAAKLDALAGGEPNTDAPETSSTLGVGGGPVPEPAVQAVREAIRKRLRVVLSDDAEVWEIIAAAFPHLAVGPATLRGLLAPWAARGPWKPQPMGNNPNSRWWRAVSPKDFLSGWTDRDVCGLLCAALNLAAARPAPEGPNT